MFNEGGLIPNRNFNVLSFAYRVRRIRFRQKADCLLPVAFKRKVQYSSVFRLSSVVCGPLEQPKTCIQLPALVLPLILVVDVIDVSKSNLVTTSDLNAADVQLRAT